MTKAERIKKQIRADVQAVDAGIDQILRVGDIAAIDAWNRVRSAVLRALRVPHQARGLWSSSTRPTSRRLPRPAADDGVQYSPEVA